MINVLIVDDEPFIRQGLRILIPWEELGYLVSGEASNGIEAMELINHQTFDLVITDIKMPQMSGIDLIDYAKVNISSEIKFIIISGFYEFEFAKKAIKYEVVDYVLKPVQKEELIRVLIDFKEDYDRKKVELRIHSNSEKALFDRYMNNILYGVLDGEELAYVNRFLPPLESYRYMELNYDKMEEQYFRLPIEEKRLAQLRMYEGLKTILKDHWYHGYLESVSKDQEYMVGCIYMDSLSKEQGKLEKEFIEYVYESLKKQLTYNFMILIGPKVDDITMLQESYKGAKMIRYYQEFNNDSRTIYYEQLNISINSNTVIMDKEYLDNLLRAIEENNEIIIQQYSDGIYEKLKNCLLEPEMIRLTLNYLVFNMLHIAKELDSDANHEEIFQWLNQNTYDQMTIQRSIRYFKKFALQFAAYISQLRQHSFGGVLKEVEREITENYRKNLSLKYLSEKYYINSAYLGQIFKKQYGIGFKDYLNNYRIDKAAELLLRTDEKIYLIAYTVGFNNTDYFINKFVQLKGITPLQYRKQLLLR